MVEVVAGPAAAPATVDRVAAALARTGKEPIVLDKPVVGRSNTILSCRWLYPVAP